MKIDLMFPQFNTPHIIAGITIGRGRSQNSKYLMNLPIRILNSNVTQEMVSNRVLISNNIPFIHFISRNDFTDVIIMPHNFINLIGYYCNDPNG
jgi:hypothetical protein